MTRTMLLVLMLCSVACGTPTKAVDSDKCPPGPMKLGASCKP